MSLRFAPAPAHPPADHPPTGPSAPPARPPAGAPPRPGRRRRRVLGALVVVALIAALGAAVVPRLAAPKASANPGGKAQATSTQAHRSPRTSATTGGAATSATSSAAASKARPAPAVHYSFDDEFSGPAGAGPNYGFPQRYWLSDPCWTNGCGFPPQPTRYSLANATLDGHGHLVLTARDGATGRCGTIACRYTSARLTMLDWSPSAAGAPTWSQEYGTFSARIKVPVGADVFPAFFLVGSNLSVAGWPPAGEIDVFDGVGSADVAEQQAEFGTSSYEVPFGGAFVLPKGETFAGWHVYTMSWSPAGIVWSVDGRKTLSMPASRAGSEWASCFEHPFSMVLELEIGSAMDARTAAKVLPARMLVDWVRARAGG